MRGGSSKGQQHCGGPITLAAPKKSNFEGLAAQSSADLTRDSFLGRIPPSQSFQPNPNLVGDSGSKFDATHAAHTLYITSSTAKIRTLILPKAFLRCVGLKAQQRQGTAGKEVMLAGVGRPVQGFTKNPHVRVVLSHAAVLSWRYPPFLNKHVTWGEAPPAQAVRCGVQGRRTYRQSGRAGASAERKSQSGGQLVHNRKRGPSGAAVQYCWQYDTGVQPQTQQDGAHPQAESSCGCKRGAGFADGSCDEGGDAKGRCPQ